jgi:hypothetical protein
MAASLVNPTDLLDALALLDQVTDDLRTTRLGLRLLRRSWRTSSAGLLTAVRASSSLAAATAECSALLSFMATSGLDASQDQAMRPPRPSTTFLTSWITDPWSTPLPANGDED